MLTGVIVLCAYGHGVCICVYLCSYVCVGARAYEGQCRCHCLQSLSTLYMGQNLPNLELPNSSSLISQLTLASSLLTAGNTGGSPCQPGTYMGAADPHSNVCTVSALSMEPFP